MYTSAALITSLLASLATAVPANVVARAGATITGKGTVYTQGGVAGSCGDVNPDSAMIVALSKNIMPGYKAPNCGRKIKVKNMGSQWDVNVKGKGNEIIVTVADTCDGCDATHIDFSTGAWNKLTDNSTPSAATVEWEFVDGVTTQVQPQTSNTPEVKEVVEEKKPGANEEEEKEETEEKGETEETKETKETEETKETDEAIAERDIIDDEEDLYDEEE